MNYNIYMDREKKMATFSESEPRTDVLFLHSPNNPVCLDFTASVHFALRQIHPSVNTVGPFWEDIKECNDLTDLCTKIASAKVVLCVFGESITSKQEDTTENSIGLNDTHAKMTAQKTANVQQDAASSSKHEVDDHEQSCLSATGLINPLNIKKQNSIFEKCVETAWFECCNSDTALLPVVLGQGETPPFLRGLSAVRFSNWSPLNTSKVSKMEWNCLIGTLSRLITNDNLELGKS